MEMKEEWLMPGAVVTVDAETTAALVAEIKRLIVIIGGMALKESVSSFEREEAAVARVREFMRNH